MTIVVNSKICSKCTQFLPVSSFGKRSDRPGKVRPSCLACEKQRSQSYKARNAEKVAAANDKRRRENPSLAADASAKYKSKHKEKIRLEEKARRLANGIAMRAREAELYAENREKVLARKAAYRIANGDAVRAAERRRRAANPEKQRQTWRVDNQKRRATSKGKLENAIRAAVHVELKGGTKRGRKTFELLGWTCSELMGHLERQFTEGMSWENYGLNGWHIDHEIPLAAHNYESPYHIDFRRAWALSNLRPLWSFDNRSKGAKLSEAFQPSLAL